MSKLKDILIFILGATGMLVLFYIVFAVLLPILVTLTVLIGFLILLGGL